MSGMNAVTAQEPRQYQLEMFAASMQQNTIVAVSNV